VAAGRPYVVSVATRAAKDLRRLPGNTQSAVIEALDGLALDPRGGKPLSGELAGIWSLRRGDYRILYRIDDRAFRVEIARVGHRREVYRRASVR
jgi:mRNA interferase RelE/StbE